jgi:hypothetical protein
MMAGGDRLVWHQLHWQRPITIEQVTGLLRLWAADPRQPKLVLEVQSDADGLRYLLAAPQRVVSAISTSVVQTLPGTVMTVSELPRRSAHQVVSLRLSSRERPLRTAEPELVLRGLLGALDRVHAGERLSLQLVLGHRKRPRVVPAQRTSQSPAAVWPRPAGAADTEARTAQRIKQTEPGFGCLLRIGIEAAEPGRRRSLTAGVLGALRAMEAPGVAFGVRQDAPERLAAASSPWIWPLALNVVELASLTGWPVGESDLPGVASLHPRQLPPTPALSATPERVVALATAPGHDRPIGLSAQASLRHTWVLGPTGSGKSTLLLGLIAGDIAAGRGLVVIEPKGDLVEAVLARIPTERADDVIVLDPIDSAPVGLNPLAGTTAEQVRVDGLLSVFRALYADSWGPRTADILHACLLSLVRYGDASLLMVPVLLTNAAFRRSVVQQVTPADPVALGPFWSWYEALSDAERGAVIAPVMNKLRAFLLSPALRAVLGQRHPKLDLAEVLREGRILLVPLRKDQLGNGTAQLLGSLVVAQLWQATLGRSAMPERARRPVMVFIDEVQNYLHLPTDLGDALAQARGLGVGFTLAHQYLAQLPRELHAGLLANVRSRILFQLDHSDAVVMAKGHPELSAEDISALNAFEVYASLFAGNRVSPYVSGRTFPEPPELSDAEEIRCHSRAHYGQPLKEVEQEVLDLLAPQPEAVTNPGGRRRRSS